MNTDTAEPLLLTVAEAVKMSGISRTQMYRYLSCGKVKAKKVGRSTLILTDSLRDLINRLPDFG